MKKKRFVSMFLVGSVLCSCMAFSSVVKIDEMLTTATEITRKIFTANAEDNSTIGYISSSYLQGMDSQEDYILSQCATGGYAIYEAESMELIEYSDSEFSPYMEFAETDRYYAGPVNYFVEDGDNLKNVHTKQRMSKKHGEKIAKEFKEKTKKDREKRKQKKEQKEKSKDKNSIEENATGEAIEIQSDAMIDPGPTGIQKWDADQYIVKSRTYIDEPHFFIGNHGHGYNFDGTCASVAAQLLLAYNNWAKDGRLIPTQTSNSAEQFLHPDRTENSRLAPYSDIMRGTNSSDISNDGIISLYEKLKEYINPYARSYNEKDTVAEHPDNDGANLYNTEAGIIRFINMYSSLMSYDWLIDCAYDEENAAEVLKNEIDENRAAIASIDCYIEKDEQVVVEGHQVVVYGYQTIKYKEENINGFIAHFGWNAESEVENQDKNTNIWFNSSWLNGYLTLEMNHSHAKTVIENTNEHVLECKNCNATFISSTHLIHAIRDLENGDIGYDRYYDDYHMASCKCGYEFMNVHLFKYEVDEKKYTQHIISCECGYKSVGSHYIKRGESCFFCGYYLGE
ncbi:MAG: hypothetical protein IJA89_04265 [Clostridia bacterium]|nr:hypothetical protein [Clostridia bacterium]